MNSYFFHFQTWALKHKTWVLSGFLILLVASLLVTPFFSSSDFTKSFQVSVDAIPDLSENQQILLTEWPGRSPQTIEAQITYPLALNLQGLKGVKKVRAYSYFGFSIVFVIFEDKIAFYESRTRLLEKISLSKTLLPPGVSTTLGPDATGLGQIFWYTLEGEGWSAEELRAVQDWQVKPYLSSTSGVSEIASIGGYVREYQIDVDPDLMRQSFLKLSDIENAIKDSSLDVGAMSLDQNRVETMVRGLGLIQKIGDLESIPVINQKGVVVKLKAVAQIQIGPALRRGILNKNGVDAVGAAVVARYGENPLHVIENLKNKISALQNNLPEKTLDTGKKSRIEIKTFYDRSVLIHETLQTLLHTLTEEILITLLVMMILLANFRAGFLVGLVLPLGVLYSFLLMKLFNVSSNLMSLAGIAIAIGAMTDMGVITTENILKRLKERSGETSKRDTILAASVEIAPALMTSSLMILVSFFPVFLLSGAEGKLFSPLAWTKTFAISCSVLIALILIPIGAQLLWAREKSDTEPEDKKLFSPQVQKLLHPLSFILLMLLLSFYWRPLGNGVSMLWNIVFVSVLISGILLGFSYLLSSYEKILRWALAHTKTFLTLPLFLACLSFFFLKGWDGITHSFAAHLPSSSSFFNSSFSKKMSETFPGIQTELMPTLDEGAFLYMPSTVAHASITEVSEVLAELDARLSSLPEIESVVGKAGRVDSALDPAPLGMIEILVNYKHKYQIDQATGKIKREWRAGIETQDDLWKEISRAAQIPGLTGAPKLAPIANRLLMLQTGVRSPFALKLSGADLPSLEVAGKKIAQALREVPGINPETIVAESTLNIPTLDIVPDREKISRYGLSIGDFLSYLESALGGKDLGNVLIGREKYSMRVRFLRERRDQREVLADLPVPLSDGRYLPLSELAQLKSDLAPMSIKSEDGFLTSYVLFDRIQGSGELEVVESAKQFLDREVKSGSLGIPPNVRYEFSGNYQNLVRSKKQWALVFPLALLLIWLILQFQFKSWQLSLFVFSEIAVALMGGVFLLGLFSVPHFLNLFVGSQTLHDLFHIQPIHFSVAVWVGFLALFGIANNDGVLMGTYLQTSFREKSPNTPSAIDDQVVTAGKRRILPCLMTTAITLIALLPILTSSGRGSEVMIPMAVPIIGGIVASLFGIYLVPVLFAVWKKFQLRKTKKHFEDRLIGR